jgi:CPA2 family monovalent cation:H+ antiporter-2
MSIAKTKSHELMILGTLTVALGFAYVAYAVFDASFALGAFLAGLVLNESEIGRKAADKSLPLRDAFAVLFFVSVGMLFNPFTLVSSPMMVALTVLIIVAGKGLAAIMIASLFKQDKETTYTVAIGLAQIGEFSFILAGLAMAQGMITQDIYNLILAGALLSIALNPFLFRWLNRYYPVAGQVVKPA